MDLSSLRTEIILSHSHSTLGYQYLDWNLQPGGYLEIDGQPYLVLERKHRYLLKSGRYQLHQIALYVQQCSIPVERSLLNGQWLIGDITCLYNAHSEVLRCAVNPTGPCDRCPHYHLREH